MHGYRDAAKFKRDVQLLVARQRPQLLVLVVLGALHAAVDRVGHGARDLREGKARVDDGDELTARRAGHDALYRDGLAVRPNDAVHVGEDGPVLVRVGERGHVLDRQFGLAGDVREARDELADGELAGKVIVGVALAVEEDGDVVL